MFKNRKNSENARLNEVPAEMSRRMEQFFVEQLHTPLGSLAEAGTDEFEGLPTINSFSDLEKFLTDYRQKILVTLELKTIVEAFFHCSLGRARELIHLDATLSKTADFRAFAGASRRAGCLQLRRLRPLKDHRVLQKYLRSVEESQAVGWHPIVYGIFLSVYSFPIREGLMHYCQQTIGGLVRRAGTSIGLTLEQMMELQNAQLASMPSQIEVLLPPSILVS